MSGILRRALFAGTALTIVATAGAMPARAESSAEQLAAVLANKGVISQSEAQSIRSAPAAAQQGRLVSILRKKGVLGDDDVKTLKPEARPVAIASPDPSSAMAANTPRPAADPMYRKAAVTVGGFEITPVGYIALTTVSRSNNTTNPNGTNFFAIPFNNSIGGELPETRITANSTRLGLRAHSAVNSWLDVIGYFEGDFLGNDATNVFVTSNSHTFRLRLGYMDINAGQFEFTAGQTWSWITPNRKGLGPDPKNVFTTLNVDPNIQVGLPWARQAAAHVAWHPNQEFAIGIGVENPDQFGGQVGEVTFPALFNAQLSSQIDEANQTGVPNKFPDVVGKATFDTDIMDRHVHFEGAGVWRTFAITDLVITGASSAFVNHSANGWGAQGSANVELFKGFNVLGTGFWSDGGGRYLFGMGPDLVVLPTASGLDVDISTVQSHGFVFGAEWQAARNTILAAYYGETFFQNNFALDNTAGARPNTFIGFGGPNSANNNNKLIQEWTADIKHTYWSDPRLGAIQSLFQYSYIQRETWFTAAGAPPEAHTHQIFTEFRYLFPG